MYVRFGYGYSRQSNYCALVTSVQNTLVSYRKVRPFAFNSNLRYVRVLRATCRQAQPVVLRAYAVIFHSQDDRKEISISQYHFIRYLFSPYNRHHNTLFADKSGDYNSKIITHLPIIGARNRTLQCEMDGSLYVPRHSPRFATALPFTLPDNFYLLYLHLLALLSTKHNADNGIRTHMVK